MSEKKKSTSPFEGIFRTGKHKAMDLFTELLSNPTFAQAMGTTIQGALEAKGKLDKNLQTVLRLMNLPTKANYDSLSKRVAELTRMLNQLEYQVKELVVKVQDLSAKTMRKSSSIKTKSKINKNIGAPKRYKSSRSEKK